MTPIAQTWSGNVAVATNPVIDAVRRRLWWAGPLLAWNAGMVYLNFLAHSPIMTVLTAGSLAAAYIVVISDPDETEDDPGR